ncbi:hypothetical protein LOAG_12261, partial [Loa loa]
LGRTDMEFYQLWFTVPYGQHLRDVKSESPVAGHQIYIMYEIVFPVPRIHINGIQHTHIHAYITHYAQTQTGHIDRRGWTLTNTMSRCNLQQTTTRRFVTCHILHFPINSPLRTSIHPYSSQRR